jgi:hypothetical protein
MLINCICLINFAMPQTLSRRNKTFLRVPCFSLCTGLGFV